MTTTTTGVSAPAWLSEALEWVGLRWPSGDVSGLNAAADAWLALADGLRQQETVASGAAKAVWQPPHAGQFPEAFAAWWRADMGPGANLVRSAAAVEQIAASLRGLGVQVTILRAAFVANLAALATALAGAGLLIVGSGGLLAVLAGAGSAALITTARRAMLRALEAALVVVGAVLVGQVLRKAAEGLRPVVVPTPSRGTRNRPGRNPDPKPRPWPVPIPFPRDWDPTQRPRCQVSPSAIIPTTPVFTGDLDVDRRTAGGAIFHIDGQVLDDPKLARQVTIDGIVQDPIARQHFETKYVGLADSIGLSPGEYQLSHLYGAGFGSEAAAGIYLAPSDVNLSFQKRAENFVRDLNDSTGPDGWVELRAVATTQPAAAWNGTGANLLASADYEATVCRPNTVLQTYRFGVEVGPPTGTPGGAVQPGRISIYGLVP